MNHLSQSKMLAQAKNIVFERVFLQYSRPRWGDIL